MGCRTRIVYHELYARRGFTALRQTWNRYQLALATLAESPLRRAIPYLEAPAATECDLLRVHTAEYVDLIQQLDLIGRGKLDGSTPAWSGMYARAERVVGGSLRAADLLASGHALHVFNPAGGQHHAFAGQGGGFCVFNDVVAAVRRLQDHGLERIAILDLDGHHGDGTEGLLLAEPILTISLHQYGDHTYPGTGRSEDIGRDRGRGHTVNVPLARGTGDAAYSRILRETIEPVLRAYAPQMLIIEYGTDGHHADPLLRLQLSTRHYRDTARWFHQLAHQLCDGRLLVVGGGGYQPQQVVHCWQLMLGELCGEAHPHPEADRWLHELAPPAKPAADDASLWAARQTRLALTDVLSV